MKVAFVCQYFDMVLPPHQNSVGIWTYEVARRLHEQAEPTVIARRSLGAPGRAWQDGASFEFVSCAPVRLWNAASRLWTLAGSRADPLFSQRFYALDYRSQVMRRLRKHQPDIVHLQNFPQYALAIRRAVPNAAIILHMHCNWLDQLDYTAMKESVAAVDLIAGCSEHVVMGARRRFADLGARFAVLPNGVVVEPSIRTHARSTGETVLFVGRVSPEKGLHTLLEAWSRVVAARPAARLDIVGPLTQIPRDLLVDLSDDPDVLALSRFYRRDRGDQTYYYSTLRAAIPPELAHTISFCGYEPHDRVMARCATSAVLVCPSLSESFGMSLIEALSVGTPVVATRAGGMPEIIAATGGGLLVDKNNPGKLADAIIQMLASPKLREEMGDIGAVRVADLYSWSRVTDLTLDLYRLAISQQSIKYDKPSSDRMSEPNSCGEQR